MKTILHKADTRGHASHGWLDTYHTFSFASYHDPQRVHFGALRVLNDDTVDGGMGFGMHPHNNMEIITIPMEGALEHKDSMGNTGVVRKNDVQVMSAGTGVMHSEYNRNQDEKVSLLQIWVLPQKKNITPRYAQKTYDAGERENKWQNIVYPQNGSGEIWINQDAWFHLARLQEGKELSYQLKKQGSGVYIFMIEGAANVAGTDLERRDGLGIWEMNDVTMKAKANSEILLMEVPMEV